MDDASHATEFVLVGRRGNDAARRGCKQHFWQPGISGLVAAAELLLLSSHETQWHHKRATAELNRVLGDDFSGR